MVRHNDYSRKLATVSNQLIALRADPTKTAERFDEIIKLRQLLLELLEVTATLEGPQADRILPVRMKISNLSSKWGRKGDCV